MPYDYISDLPDTVRNSLPKQAQEIYQAAFNSAWDQYAQPEDRRGDDSRAEVSHKVAWAAVKNDYEKDADGNWVRKKD